ncbi:MAG: TetR/AcrR family transcriptional regulator [Halanaerobiales bacterium]|nr:TetR/AcrR family transcriptional regulator [Halanaerobiales bacterium]
MKEDTKMNIMTKATKLFAQKGFSETSISQIAKKANVGKGTIYWHFDSKEDLFFSIIKQKGKAFFDSVIKLKDSNKEPQEIIHEYIIKRVEFSDNNYDVAKMLINNNEMINRDFKEVIEKKHLEVLKVIENTIQKGIKTGVFREGNPHEYALMIINTANSANIFKDHGLKDSTEKSKAEKIFEFIMNGLKGKEDRNAEK